MSKIKQGGLRVPSMQCNVNGDDEALSLTTIKETEWLNHMRQNVEDHQQRERGRERERERERQRGYTTHCCQASWKWKSP